MKNEAEVFWDRNFEGMEAAHLSKEVGHAVSEAVAFFGPLKGKRVLDLGCGNGGTSLFLAAAGAEVTAVDFSAVAIDTLNRHVREAGITNLTGIQADARDIARLGTFDFIFGSFILHHIEPFSEFSRTLRSTLNAGGKAYFFENNAASNLLIWFRRNVVGKFGVPRYGDDDEFPLSPAEVDMLRQHFQVQVRIPEMLFFQLASIYVFKRKLLSVAKMMDDFAYRLEALRRYSYRQSILLQA
ncbi:class I SAM-dependent methyltransferase [Methylobacterium trifolii]|uniref:Ubiquinone biosynthesis O-methyltransferase, mitochondrial n=1 Tax=Methylobacterium trifolii TaxID=1003092 RepID=A0ABQ4TZB8_9HYPH|nr:class I SAM-dependent methyltransferase [Methylobacterium trifolii]GJE60227.1 Ubiquinone biosynthesis O-methyltransferase, mitochondrial [Methylobacterium trifolii]